MRDGYAGPPARARRSRWKRLAIPPSPSAWRSCRRRIRISVGLPGPCTEGRRRGDGHEQRAQVAAAREERRREGVDLGLLGRGGGAAEGVANQPLGRALVDHLALREPRREVDASLEGAVD